MNNDTPSRTVSPISRELHGRPGDPQGRKNWKSELWQRIHDPFQLRVILTTLVLLIGYLGIDQVLGEEVAAATRRLRSERKRLELIREVQGLRADYKLFANRLPTPSIRGEAKGAKKAKNKSSSLSGNTTVPAAPDADEWTRFVLSGIRKQSVKLVLLESDQQRAIGPYKAVVLRIALEGSFTDLAGFLRWLDTNERLLRVERVLLEPLRNTRALSLQLTVLGVMG